MEGIVIIFTDAWQIDQFKKKRALDILSVPSNTN